MLALAITVSTLILIALFRFGVIVEYSEDGFRVWIRFGFIKRLVFGEGVKKKPDKKKPKIPKEKKKILEIKPGNISVFIDMFKAVINALKRLKRRLLIKQLTLYYTSAGEDPAKTALMYGTANAVFGVVIQGLKNNFRVKHIDLKTWFDFLDTRQRIYAKFVISISVWEILYVLFALFPIITSIFKAQPDNKVQQSNTNIRKDGQKNGKSSDQRVDGNNDAKNEGDD